VREPTASVAAGVPARLWPLKWHERVRRGGFVADGRQGFEPWTGPGGFRTDAFVRQIYRRLGRRAAGAGKTP